MSLTIKICVNDVIWRTASFSGTSIISELDPNVIVIWDQNKKIYDIFDSTKPYGPQSQLQELGITSGSILYVFTPEYPTEDPSSIIPLNVLKIRKFVLTASKTFNDSKIKKPRTTSGASSSSTSSQQQALNNLFQSLGSSSMMQQKVKMMAEEIYKNLTTGHGSMYMLDFPEVVEHFEKNRTIAFDEFHQFFQEHHKEMLRREALMSDPSSEEGQRLIQQKIDRKRIEHLYSQSLDHHPEDMIPVTMLYINLTINNVPVKAFIDSGAQVSLMSLACAQRCNLTGLIDRRFQGHAKGVGGLEKFEGKIHLCDVKVENAHFLCPFNIMANREMDLLIGLNTLRKHNCTINLSKNRLEFPDGTSTPFLQSHEIDQHLIDIEVAPREEVMDTSDAPSNSNQ